MNASTETVQRCILCDLPGEPLYKGLHDRLFGREGDFTVRTCSSCGLLWLDPRPSAGEIGKYYENYSSAGDLRLDHAEGPVGALSACKEKFRSAIFRAHYGYRNIDTGFWFDLAARTIGRIPFVRERAAYDLGALFGRYAGPDALVVDIGCGSGNYLKIMQNAGWRVLGIEPSPAAAESAKKRGIRVFTGTLDAAQVPAGSADQVTMIHVLEHLSDPRSAVMHCYNILKPGGRLVMRTPNALSWGSRRFGPSWFALDPPRHFFIFSAENIQLLFRGAGFRRLSFRTRPEPAPYIFDRSAAIERSGHAEMDNAPQQRGRSIFSLVERAACLMGLKYGEELEIVAVK